jgi:hypothetical protein
VQNSLLILPTLKHSFIIRQRSPFPESMRPALNTFSSHEGPLEGFAGWDSKQGRVAALQGLSRLLER